MSPKTEKTSSADGTDGNGGIRMESEWKEKSVKKSFRSDYWGNLFCRFFYGGLRGAALHGGDSQLVLN